MFRFTIRDVLWLTVVVALAVGWWIDRKSISDARASLEAQRTAVKVEEVAWRARTQKAIDRFNRMVEDYEARQQWISRFNPPASPISEAEREQAKRRSDELGAPQQAPLPPGYGETQNAQ